MGSNGALILTTYRPLKRIGVRTGRDSFQRDILEAEFTWLVWLADQIKLAIAKQVLEPLGVSDLVVLGAT